MTNFCHKRSFVIQYLLALIISEKSLSKWFVCIPVLVVLDHQPSMSEVLWEEVELRIQWLSPNPLSLALTWNWAVKRIRAWNRDWAIDDSLPPSSPWQCKEEGHPCSTWRCLASTRESPHQCTQGLQLPWCTDRLPAEQHGMYVHRCNYFCITLILCLQHPCFSLPGFLRCRSSGVHPWRWPHVKLGTLWRMIWW